MKKFMKKFAMNTRSKNMNEKELLIMKIIRRKNVLIEDFNVTKNAVPRNQHRRWMKPKKKMKTFYWIISRFD